MPLTLFEENKMLNFKSILTTLVATIITVGAGIWITRFTGPLPISVTQVLTEKQTTFNTNGESEISAVPDQAEIRLGIEVRQSTVKAAQDQANQAINNMTNSFKKIGIDKEDIQTQNYVVSPNYDYESQEQKITGYRVSVQMAVKLTDFEKLNQAIDIATELGANQVGSVNFSLSKEKQKELTKQAREEAIAEAKEDAKELSKLAGIKLGKIVNVTESQGGNYPMPMYAREMALDQSKSGEPTQIEPGSEVFLYSVTLSYETL